MIYVDRERCDGCEECIDLCSAGAISLREGKAFIEESLCEGCEACLRACPQEAILSVEVVEPLTTAEVVSVGASQANKMIPVRVQPLVPSWREVALPAIGSALVWAGREVLPRLASLGLDWLDRSIQTADRMLPVQRPQIRPQVQPRQFGGQRLRCRYRRRRNKCPNG